MSNSSTLLDLISSAQAQKEVTANALFDAASPSMIFGRRAAACVALTWGYYGGVLSVAGTLSAINNGTVALTANATNYVEADTAGTVSRNTSGFTAGRTRLYTIIAGAATVTSYTDWRTASSLANAGFLTTVNVFSKNQSVATVALTDAATIVTNASLSNNFKATLAGNRVLANPTNLTEGMILNFAFRQDATGGRTLVYDTLFKFPGGIVPTLSTAAAAKDLMSCYYDGSVLLCNLSKGFA